jgi:hypothetical protein
MKIDTSGPTDWRKLREFAAVDLDQSYILSWHIESETLMIDVDVHLTSEHPFYEKPRPAEKVCIRPAIIEFPICEQVIVGDDTSSSKAELVERLGHGVIEGLQRHQDGRYEINGEFGTVFVFAERPLLRLKGP